jgi:hypothetical protein
VSKKKTLNSYEVGYGKPPKKTQFQKGVSGNPTGRSKKAPDFDSELLQESKSFITINENGRPRRISKHGIVIKQLMKLAMTGNIPANLCCSLSAVTRNIGAAIQRPRKETRFAIHRREIGGDARCRSGKREKRKKVTRSEYRLNRPLRSAAAASLPPPMLQE